MKIYKVKKGTKGLLRTHKPDGSVSHVNWFIRSNMTFGDHELIIDPVRLHNNPESTVMGAALAMQGYSVFMKEGQMKYSLAVKYDEVETVC